MSQLDDIATRFQVQLEGLKNSNQREYNRIQGELSKIFREEVGTDEITELSRPQLERLIDRIRSTQTIVTQEATARLVKSLKDLAFYSYEFEVSAIIAATTVETLSTQSRVAALWDAITEHPLSVDGSLVKPWLDKLTNVQLTATENLIRRAYVESWSNRQMIQAYQGTKALRYTDGIVATVGRSNETVIRTVMQHVNSVSRMKVWEENEDVVKGYRWVSTLDSRTSSKCRHLDGEEFKLGEGPLPPIHPNCRSTTVPVLDKVFEELRSGLTRESSSGPVPQKLTYYEWLKRQSAEFQEEVLGESRAKLFRDSGMAIDEFNRLQLNRYFKPLTLAEMRRLKPLAFERAGI